MKRTNNDRVKIRVFGLLTVGMLFFNAAVFAQPTTDPTGDPDATSGTTTELVPVDGGITLLLGAGVALGVKKIYGKKKRRFTKDNLS